VGSSGSGSTSADHAARYVSTMETLPSKANRLCPRQVWELALAAGVAAGLVSWLAGELAHDVFKPRLYETEVMGMKTMQPTALSQNAADSKNARLAMSILGCITGLALGVAGGLADRSPSRAVTVGLAGAAAAGPIAALASWALLPFFFRSFVPDPEDVLPPILIHGGIWAAIGAIGGAAFAIGAGRVRRAALAVVGACVGACLASVVFHVFSLAIFPDSRSTEPLASSSFVRLLAALVVTVLIAIGAVLGVQGPASFLAPAPAPAPMADPDIDTPASNP